MRRRLIVAAALGLTLVGVAGARPGNTAGGALSPRTLVSVPSRIGIASFAQDGDRIAWLQAATLECESLKPTKPLRIRSLSTGTQVALPSTQVGCDLGGPVGPRTLALAGRRALWTITRSSHSYTDGLFVSAAVDDHAERRACGFAVIGGSEDSYVPTLATAGDGRTLAFTMDGDSFYDKICTGLWLVDERGRARRITDRGPTLLAVGGSRIALAQPIDLIGHNRSSVVLRGAGSGRVIATITAAGRVHAIALSQSTVALLVDGRFGRRIALFDASSRASRGTVSVPAATAPELSAAGANVVFRVRNTIYRLDGQRLTKRVLAVAKSTPIGLSIEGRRVAWAENDSDRSRIRAIDLPVP